MLSSNRRLNEVVKEYYSSLYLTRYSSFLMNRFFGDLKLVKSQSEYLLNSSEPGILESRRKFTGAFDVPPYSLSDGEQVASAFKDTISKKMNKQ